MYATCELENVEGQRSDQDYGTGSLFASTFLAYMGLHG